MSRTVITMNGTLTPNEQRRLVEEWKKRSGEPPIVLDQGATYMSFADYDGRALRRCRNCGAPTQPARCTYCREVREERRPPSVRPDRDPR